MKLIALFVASSVRVDELALNVPADMVKSPVQVMEDAPAVNVAAALSWVNDPTDTGLPLALNVPELMLNAPETASELVPSILTVPEYPFMVNEATAAAVLMVHPELPVVKYAASLVIGTENPLVPPDVSDQLAVEFQSPGAAATQ